MPGSEALNGHVPGIATHPAEGPGSAGPGKPVRPQAIGVDLVDIGRLQRMILRSGDAFLERVFTAAERQAAHGARGWVWDSLAGKVAAKEAVKKVLAGRGHVAGWTEIEVHHGCHGEPLVRLHGRAGVAVGLCGFESLQLSIAHEKGMAIAVVLAM